MHTNALRVHLIVGMVAGASLAPGSLAAQMVSRALGEPFAWQVVRDEDRPTVSGIVLNASGDAFPGVLLSMPELEVHALSDSAGRFEFDAPPPGEWIVSVEMIGHETIEGRIAVPPDASVRMAVIFHRPMAICTNACIGTGCTTWPSRSWMRRPAAGPRLRFGSVSGTTARCTSRCTSTIRGTDTDVR